MTKARIFLPLLLPLCFGWTAIARAGMSADELGALREKAEAGDPIAQHNAGLKYADVKDAFYNPIEAYAWLKLASLNGASGGGFDELKAQLTATQIAEGDRRAEELLSARAARVAAAEAPVAPGDPSGAPADIKKYSEELAAAWKESDLLKTEIATLRAAAANFEGERNALLQKLSAAPAPVAAAPAGPSQGDLDAANAKVKALTEDLSTAKAAAALSAAQAAKVSALDAQVVQLTRANAELKASLEKAASVTPPASQQSQLEEAQVKLESALRSYDLQQKEVDRLQKAIVSIDAERAALSDQVAALKAAPAAAPAPAPAQTTVALPVPAEVPAAERSALEDTQMKLETALHSFQLKQDEVDGLKQTIATLESEKASLSAQLASTTTQLAQTRSEAAVTRDASAQLEATREQLRQTQNQLASVVSERVQMRDQISSGTSSSGSLLSAPQRPQRIALAAAPTPTPSPVARTYTVVEGDTLTKIAKRIYGDADKWAEIYEANRDVVRSPQSLAVGVKLRLP